jgi:hypothetical protein
MSNLSVDLLVAKSCWKVEFHSASLLCNSAVHAVHPALLPQFPIFVYTAASIRYMAGTSWPGFSSEGALWFPDLTQQAMQLGHAADAAVLLPMGLPGLILPLAVTGMMLTSIRLGFRASGGPIKWGCYTTSATANCAHFEAGVQTVHTTCIEQAATM